MVDPELQSLSFGICLAYIRIETSVCWYVRGFNLLSSCSGHTIRIMSIVHIPTVAVKL